MRPWQRWCAVAGLLWVTACGSSAGSGMGVGSGSDVPHQGRIPRPWHPTATADGLPTGRACMDWLSRMGILHRPLDRLTGVATPVEVSGPIAGITYLSAGRTTLVGDCRLMLALDWAGRSLAMVGVNAIRHSGAYVYRTTSSGRLSLHASGLAIDVHAVRVGDVWYDVRRDYRGGGGPVCDSLQPFLNHVYCRLHQLNLFRELITPDHNAEHHDHLHLGIARR